MENGYPEISPDVHFLPLKGDLFYPEEKGGLVGAERRGPVQAAAEIRITGKSHFLERILFIAPVGLPMDIRAKEKGGDKGQAKTKRSPFEGVSQPGCAERGQEAESSEGRSGDKPGVKENAGSERDRQIEERTAGHRGSDDDGFLIDTIDVSQDIGNLTQRGL